MKQKRLHDMTYCILIIIALLVVFTACNKKVNPAYPEPTNIPTPASTPTATQTSTPVGLFISKAVIIQNLNASLNETRAEIILKCGDVSGDYVSGSTIQINSVPLIESTPGHYVCSLPIIPDSSIVTCTINSSAGNTIVNILTPYKAEIITPTSDVITHSHLTNLYVTWIFFDTTGLLPDSSFLYMWNPADSTVYINYDMGWLTNYQTENILAPVPVPANTTAELRIYAMNSAVIPGVNPGSSNFQFFNSKNSITVNITP